MASGPNRKKGQNQTCGRHRYDISFGSLFKRRPVYTCSECGQKLKPIKVVEIINLFLFYGLIIGIVLSPDFKEMFQGDMRQTLSIFGKFAIYLVVYLVIRFLLARFAPLEAVQEPIKKKTAEELRVEAEAKQAEQAAAEAKAAEREALQAMYREYEEAARAAESDDAADADADGETTTAEPAAGTTEVGATAEEAGAEVTSARPTPQAQACRHRLKESWKNYIPGKQMFYCRECGEPLKLSKAQNNIVMMAFLVSFIMFLWRDLTNFQVSWGQYFAKVGLVIGITTVVQAIIIHTHPLDELSPSEMERFKKGQAKKEARRQKKG